jgi:hypothetical protein
MQVVRSDDAGREGRESRSSGGERDQDMRGREIRKQMAQAR